MNVKAVIGGLVVVGALYVVYRVALKPAGAAELPPGQRRPSPLDSALGPGTAVARRSEFELSAPARQFISSVKAFYGISTPPESMQVTGEQWCEMCQACVIRSALACNQCPFIKTEGQANWYKRCNT